MSNCDKYDLSLYIENELKESEHLKISEHLKVCDQCRSRHDEIVEIKQHLKDMKEVELPVGFHEEMMLKLRPSSARFDTRHLKRVGIIGGKLSKINNLRVEYDMKKHLKSYAFSSYAYAAAGFIMILFLMGVGGSLLFTPKPPELNANLMSASVSIESSNGDGSSTITMPEPEIYNRENSISAAPSSFQDSRSFSLPNTEATKTQEAFVKSYSITLKVDDVDLALNTISNISGYNESSSMEFGNNSGRSSANVVKRVTANNYAQSKEILRNLGKIESEYETEEKISNKIIDLQTREGVKQEEVSRLLSLLQTSKSVAVMTEVETRLEIVSRELDDVRSQIMQHESNSNMPFLKIDIFSTEQPVKAQVESGFSEKIQQTFIQSTNFTLNIMESLILTISSVAFPLVIIFIVITIILNVRKQLKRRDRNE